MKYYHPQKVGDYPGKKDGQLPTIRQQYDKINQSIFKSRRRSNFDWGFSPNRIVDSRSLVDVSRSFSDTITGQCRGCVLRSTNIQPVLRRC